MYLTFCLKKLFSLSFMIDTKPIYALFILITKKYITLFKSFI